MRIGIDVDDVITDTSSMIKQYILEYDKNGEISQHMEDVMRGDMTNSSIKKFFEDNHAIIFENVKMKKYVSEVIDRFLEDGDEIFIITSRGKTKFKESEKITLEYFRKNNIHYTKILFDSFNKAQICKDNQIDVMIDDSVKYCMEVQKEQIPSILFTSDVNKSVKTHVKRVNNWIELETVITNMKRKIKH